MYENVLDIINCRTPEVAEKLFDYFASEGYIVSMAGAEINTGTEGSINSKQLTIFKPEEVKKYSSVDEMVKDLDGVLYLFEGQPCTFSVGCDVVMIIGDQTYFDVEDWGVYEDEKTGNVTIYNEDADKVITLFKGIECGTIATTALQVTTLARMAKLPDRWNVSLRDDENLKSVSKSRAIGLSELTEEEKQNEDTN